MRKATTKTGAFAAHDLELCPLVLELLDRVPADRRVGPLIVDETDGRPFAGSPTAASGEPWRGRPAYRITSGAWMPVRAPSRKPNAGADLDLIRSAATHAQASTTLRYSRGAVGKSRKVAELGQAHWGAKNGA